MADEQDNTSKTLEWGDYKALPSDVPAVSLLALAQRGWVHVFGNECASALVAWRKTDEGKVATDEQIAAWLKSRRDAKLKQIMDGELGTKRVASGPRATGIDAVIRKVVVEWLTAKLGAAGVKLPTGDKTITVGKGDKTKSFTREELIAQTVGKADSVQYAPGVTIRAEAERRHKAEADVAGEMEDIFA